MLTEYYHWLKAAHLIAVIAWMCGMLYLPRLFVYHTQVAVGSEASELFKVMERRLMRLIINPAMIATWTLGIMLAIAVNGFDPANGLWLHYKLMLVILMMVVHVMLSRYRKAFERDQNRKSGRFFRIFNEVPTLLMIAIVIIAVVKPF
jgi:protoporphyrinogen IX oxidase